MLYLDYKLDLCPVCGAHPQCHHSGGITSWSAQKLFGRLIDWLIGLFFFLLAFQVRFTDLMLFLFHFNFGFFYEIPYFCKY